MSVLSSAGEISHYLLEKSRVVQRDFYDGNFHIFYYFLAGVPEEKRHKFHLGDMSEYKYVLHVGVIFPVVLLVFCPVLSFPSVSKKCPGYSQFFWCFNAPNFATDLKMQISELPEFTVKLKTSQTPNRAHIFKCHKFQRSRECVILFVLLSSFSFYFYPTFLIVDVLLVYYFFTIIIISRRSEMTHPRSL